jgi:hypothetical protein
VRGQPFQCSSRADLDEAQETAALRELNSEVGANRDWVEFLGDYGAEGLDQLAKDLPREPWVREFLAALKPLTGTMDAA